MKRHALALLALSVWWSAGGAAAAPPVPLVSFDSGGLEARSAALILSGQEGGGLPIRVRALPEALVGNELPVLVEMDGAALLDGGDGGYGEADDEILTEVHAYLVADGGRLVGYLTQAFRVDRAALTATAEGGERVDVRFLGRLPVSEIALSGEGSGEPPLSLRVLVLRRATDSFGLRRTEVTLPPVSNTPPPVLDAPPERWLLVRATGVAADDRLLRLATPEPDWARPEEDSRTAAGLLPTFQPPERQRKLATRERLELRDDYRFALRSLAGGQTGRALDDVGALERARMEAGTREQDLARGQMEAAEELAAAEPESLVPMIHLHLSLYRRHLERREYLLSTHSRRMMEVLLTLYVKNSRSPESGEVAAGALVELARNLLDRGNLHEAREILVRALDHQPEHRTGLLALTEVNEVVGEYDAAVASARQLTRAHPDLAEGWLRLAVNERRIGAQKAARDSLGRALTTPDAPDWVLQIAHEERARDLMDDGDLAAAGALLAQALERFPEGQRLYILAAAVEQRAGAVQESRRLLARLDRLLAARGSGPDSPRLRYGDWPEEAFSASETAFVSHSTARRASLSAALAAVTGSGPPVGTPEGETGGGER